MKETKRTALDKQINEAKEKMLPEEPRLQNGKISDSQPVLEMDHGHRD